MNEIANTVNTVASLLDLIAGLQSAIVIILIIICSKMPNNENNKEGK